MTDDRGLSDIARAEDEGAADPQATARDADAGAGDAPPEDAAPAEPDNVLDADADAVAPVAESQLAAVGTSIVPPPSGWTDPLSGTDGPLYWDRTISIERARVRRYKRPVTVAYVELAGLDTLARVWGNDVAERQFVKAAKTIVREARTSDVVARVDTTRFAVLLTETNEIAAINFVERVRAACEAGLGEARDLVRIGLGWASPRGGEDLLDAIETAMERLAAELRPAT